MTAHSSAIVRETPHVNQTTRTATIVNALKRRAQAVLNDTSIDAQSRAIIRYALETNDPWLAELVRRADEGEALIGAIDFSQTPDADEDDSSDEKIEALAEIICRAGDESAAALLVLLVEHAGHRPAQPGERDGESNRQRRTDRDGHRQRMSGAERHERAEDRAAAALLHPERHGKQPSHSRIDAVKRAERHQHRPRHRHLAWHAPSYEKQ